MALLLQLLANGIVRAAVYSLLAVGFGLVLRSLRVFHVAYGAQFLAAVYSFYACATVAGLPIWLAAVTGALAGAAIGWATEEVLYQPLYRRQASSGAALIASLGFAIVVENVIVLIFGNDVKTIVYPLAQGYQLGPIILTWIQILQLVTCSLMVTFLMILTRHLRLFKAIWALGDEPQLLPVLGLPLWRLRGVVMIASGLCVGVAASLIGLEVGMDPRMGMNYLLIAAVAVIVGGVDRSIGWVAGAAALALLQSFAIWQLPARWVDSVTLLFLITVLLLCPRGLLGLRRRIEERS